MQFGFKAMDESYAHAIANWHYEGIYAFYDMDQDIEDLEELLDPHSWTGKYYAVVDECGELIGDKRLEAVLSARLCISCKNKSEKSKRGRQ